MAKTKGRRKRVGRRRRKPKATPNNPGRNTLREKILSIRRELQRTSETYECACGNARVTWGLAKKALELELAKMEELQQNL